MKKFPSEKPLQNVSKILPGQAGIGFAQGFLDVVHARQNYLQHRETEITKRIHIQKSTEIEIANIREKAHLLRDYFMLSFSERRLNFDRCFEMLDAGLNNENESPTVIHDVC